ncbi:condensin complex subunit 2/barren [Peziza echinospora]|nr:condensin complex subunit 2/barren [Peziza echinospora]
MPSRPAKHASPSGGVKIPLNDDDAEKVKRVKKRSMLQEVQIARRQSAAFAATPRKGLDGGEGSAAEGTPKTPRNPALRESINPITPLRRPVLLVNFEEWMKMANDNKINAQNSWNFALIDYFHDMSLLKEGEGINFQKASCTLDGCVKIYTSRVDSVATETGKLLSGLADGGENTRKKNRGDDEDGEDGEDGEDDEGKKKKKRAQRSSEATLAKDFSSLQLKKLELEFSVDPLFKKASADFDEGGAKGLLLNHLAIDNTGRIVFDSSDDIEDIPDEENEAEKEQETDEAGNEEIDLERLRLQFFPDLAQVDELDVCHSLKDFDLGDPSGSLNIPFLRAMDDRNDQGGIDGGDDDDNSPGLFDGGDDDDDFGMPGADGTMAFGDGEVAWGNADLKETAEGFMAPPKPSSNYGDEPGEDGLGHIGDSSFNKNNDILSYFDEALRKDWAGPEHWKIRKLKDNTKSAATTRTRKEKEVFEIDFMNPEADVKEDMLLPKSSAAINLPKTQRKSKTRHLLPEDKHFNSKNLIQLFLKPVLHFQNFSNKRKGTGGIIGARRPEDAEVDVDNVDMNEEFWAKRQMEKEQLALNPERIASGAYDANFFNDDGMDMLPPGLGDDDDDDDFAGVGGEAFEQPLPPAGSTNALPGSNQNPNNQFPTSSQFYPSSSAFPLFGSTQDQIAMGSQLVTSSRRARPEYVQYAKVAKKVDVRRLKENIWNELAMEVPPVSPSKAPVPPPAKKFTELMADLKAVYPKQTMDDISTSYCFICVLHLANEKGLVLSRNEEMTDLRIEKDMEAHGADEY